VKLTVYRRDVGPANAELVAFQDGDGVWTVATGASGVYYGTASGQRYGFAAVCASAGHFLTYINQLTVSEAIEVTQGCEIGDAAASRAYSVSGNVTGLSAGDIAAVLVGYHAGFSAADGAYAVKTNSGNFDLIAENLRNAPYKYILAHNFAVTANVTKNLDFAAEGVAAVPHALSLANVDATWTTNVYSRMETALGTVADFAGGDSTQWLALPVAQIQANDLHSVDVLSVDSSATKSREVTRYVTTPADLSLTLPADLGAVGAQTYVTSPTALVEFNWDAYPSATAYQMTTGSAFVFSTITTSTGWLGSSAQYDYRQPDLTALPGWSSSWSPPGKTMFFWKLAAVSSSRGIPGVLFEPYVLRPTAALDGSTVQRAQRSGSIDVP